MTRRVLAAAAVALAAAAPASAGDIGVRLALTPGKLSVAAQSGTVAAGGTRSFTVKVADARGTGAGWTLRFRSGSGLAVTGITARCAAGSTCTLPSAAAAPSGATVLQAARDTGMGVMQLVVTVRASTATTVAFAVA